MKCNDNDPVAYAIVVMAHFSKTAQYNTGPHTIVIKCVPGGLLDPVYWLQRYYQLVPATPDGPLLFGP